MHSLTSSLVLSLEFKTFPKPICLGEFRLFITFGYKTNWHVPKRDLHVVFCFLNGLSLQVSRGGKGFVKIIGFKMFALRGAWCVFPRVKITFTDKGNYSSSKRGHSKQREGGWFQCSNHMRRKLEWPMRLFIFSQFIMLSKLIVVLFIFYRWIAVPNSL